MRDDTGIPRRTLLQGAAVLGATALAGGAVGATRKAAFAEDGKAGAAPQDAEAAISQGGMQYGFLVRMSNCVNCQQCVEACRKANGTPEDVAQAMVYLAGAGFVTGQNLPVNGGFVL